MLLAYILSAFYQTLLLHEVSGVGIFRLVRFVSSTRRKRKEDKEENEQFNFITFPMVDSFYHWFLLTEIPFQIFLAGEESRYAQHIVQVYCIKFIGYVCIQLVMGVFVTTWTIKAVKMSYLCIYRCALSW